MMRLSIIIHPILLFAALILSLSIFAQSGSGDLPSVPKTSAKAKPKPVTRPKTPAKTVPKTIVAKEPTKIDKLVFDQLMEGKIDPQSAGRIPPNTYYQEYNLSATEVDLFTIHLLSPTSGLKVEIIDASKNALPLKYDEHSGEFRLLTPSTTLPESGDYRVRVIATSTTSLATPIPYTLKFNHTGLTAAGYQERLTQIINAFNLPGERKVDEAVGQLERLTQDDPKQPGGFEYLGMIYNEYKQDLPKAAAAMLQAIKLGGAATFKITHDSRWRRPIRERKGQKMVWEDQRTSWLKISSKQLIVADFTTPTKAIATLTGLQITEVTRTPLGPFMLVKHNIKLFKPDTVVIGFTNPAEAEIAVDLIKANLLKKE